MATLTFYIRPSATNKTKGTIVLSYSWERSTPFRKSLKMTIPIKSWDEKRQRLKNTSETSKYRDEFNGKLDELESFFEGVENQSNSKKTKLTTEVVSQYYEVFINGENETIDKANNSFVNSLERYINELPYLINKTTKKPVSNRTVQSFRTTKSYIVKYEDFHKTILNFEDINLNFHKSFMLFLQNNHKLALNTVGGYVKDIKSFCKYSSRNNNVNPESLSPDFFVVKEETEAVYLDEKEIDLIFNHDFSNNKRHENVRDWMIIGLWTGLRASDWQKVENIKEGFLTVKMQKTDGVVIIPIHWQIEEIIKKRGIPKPVSDVEFNRIIKKVCSDVKITEKVKGSRRSPETNRKETGIFEKHLLISSHTCRRSFATNLYKADFPTLSIMKITGHKTESSFLKYIKITPKEHADKLKRHWDLKYSKK